MSPYLCPEALIEATRGTSTSQTVSGCRNGATNPPDAPSTWIGTSGGFVAPFLQVIEGGADLGHRLVAAVHGGAEDRHHADGVLVALRGGLRAAQVQPPRHHRHQLRLDLPVPAELLPAHLHVRAHHQVGPRSEEHT